jgi:diguanylate cyclase (GGDEF)-like protein
MPYQGTKELTYEEMRRALVLAKWEIRRLKRELAYDKLTGLRKSHGYFSKAAVEKIAYLNEKLHMDKSRNRGLKFPLENYHHAVAFVDMDGLKAVNDMFGHEVGDYHVKSLSSILARGTRHDFDIVVRRGEGDEFLIFYGGMTDKKIPERLEYMRARFHAAVKWRLRREMRALRRNKTEEEYRVALEMMRPKYRELLRFASFSYGWKLLDSAVTMAGVKEVICQTERLMYQQKFERGMERRKSVYEIDFY